MSDIMRKQMMEKFPTILKCGLGFGDGWLPLTNVMCELIQNHLEQKPECEPVIGLQTKEKFGTLRYYCQGGDDYIQGVIRFAERMSAHVCEECGAPGILRHENYWLKTLCDKHLKM